MRTTLLVIIGLIWTIIGSLQDDRTDAAILTSAGMIINALGVVCGAIEAKKGK